MVFINVLDKAVENENENENYDDLWSSFVLYHSSLYFSLRDKGHCLSICLKTGWVDTLVVIDMAVLKERSYWCIVQYIASVHSTWTDVDDNAGQK